MAKHMGVRLVLDVSHKTTRFCETSHTWGSFVLIGMTSPDTFETLGESKDFIEHKLRSCALSPSTCRGFLKNPWSYTQSTGPNTSFRPCLAVGTWNPTLYPSYHTPAARLQALSQEVQAPLGQKLQIREATASRPSHRHRWMVDANAITPFSIIQKRFCFRVAWMDSAKFRVSHLPRVLHQVIWLWLIGRKYWTAMASPWQPSLWPPNSVVQSSSGSRMKRAHLVGSMFFSCSPSVRKKRYVFDLCLLFWYQTKVVVTGIRAVK